MEDTKKKKIPKSREYLEKTFLEELNHKIWCTKGARFSADARFKKKSKMSNISLSFLSAYLIIASLISVYNINQNSHDNIINYLVTALSILLLVASMYENSQDYKLRAYIYHSCGIELSEIYNKLRIFKTLKENKSQSEILEFCSEINREYQIILNKYENHENIDFDTFRVKSLLYFEDELTKKQISSIKRKLSWNIYGWYVMMIVITPIIILILIMIT